MFRKRANPKNQRGSYFQSFSFTKRLEGKNIFKFKLAWLCIEFQCDLHTNVKIKHQRPSLLMVIPYTLSGGFTLLCHLGYIRGDNGKAPLQRGQRNMRRRCSQAWDHQLERRARGECIFSVQAIGRCNGGQDPEVTPETSSGVQPPKSGREGLSF